MKFCSTRLMVENLIVNNTILKPRCIEVLQKDLKNTSRSYSAMKTIISMIQQGYDMSSMYGDVLRIIDTEDYNMKLLCNLYLINTCAAKPGCQLMCINTFLKDFDDLNVKIQGLAISDCVRLSDELLIKNYAKDLRRVSSHGSSYIRQLTARSLGIFFMKNRQYFESENMNKYLSLLLNDSDMNVRKSALQSLSIIEKCSKLVPASELIKMANQFYSSNMTAALTETLNVLKYRELTEETKALYSKLLSHTDLCIFYLAASKLINDKMTLARIYQECLSFLNIRPEQEYNILLFIETFIKDVDIDIRDYLFIDTEPIYTKLVKIRIILKKIDQISDYEKLKVKNIVERVLIKKDNLSKEVLKVVLVSNIEFGTKISEILNTDELLVLLHHVKNHINKVHHEKVSSFIYNIKDTLEVEKAIELSLMFCSKIPSFVFSLTSSQDLRHVVKFFVGLRSRMLISDNQCIVYLKNLARKHPMDGYLKIVLTGLLKNDTQVIVNEYTENTEILSEDVEFKYQESKRDDILTNKPFTSSQGKCLYIIPNNINETEGGKGTEQPMNISVKTISKSAVDEGLFNYNNIVKNNQTLDFTQENTEVNSDTFPMYVIFDGFCGIVTHEKSNIILNVQHLQEACILEYSICEIEHQELIEKEGNYVLFEVNEQVKSNILNLKINNERRSVPLHLIKF